MKNAQVKRMLLNIYRFIFLAFVLGVTVFLIKFMVITNLETEAVEKEVFFNRVLYGTAINYQDPVTQKIYPGIVDMVKFTSANLEQHINYSIKDRLGAQLDLKNLKTNETKTIYLNEQWYLDKRPLFLANVQGRGSVKGYIRAVPVTIYENNSHAQGILTIHLLRQND
ncbi:hypothetical protein C4573_01280 [Candidatus Woesearchaeota archaeon]|nr:MAG: hypothetical protein C4573_01280 [Candidatus Woesearchaeota archaeon]